MSAPKKTGPRAAASKDVAPDLPAGTPGKPAVTLLSGGNPQIAKGTGDAKVQEFIDAMPGWKQDIGRQLDSLITRAFPDVHKAVKWNTPFYGLQAGTWFIAFHCLDRYVKVAFPMGAHMVPPPPGSSKQKNVRYLDIREADGINDVQLLAWLEQAAKLPSEKL